jgi:hypothetical protein
MDQSNWLIAKKKKAGLVRHPQLINNKKNKYPEYTPTTKTSHWNFLKISLNYFFNFPNDLLFRIVFPFNHKFTQRFVLKLLNLEFQIFFRLSHHVKKKEFLLNEQA